MTIWSMPSDRPRRRLLAILAADAAGYSRQMALDDLGTVAALEECRAVFRSLVAHEGGRVVDTAGDSVLAVFESATAAAEAGLAAQKELGASRVHAGSPRKLLFRIGLHLGDVIEHADGTIYGDGVNVASRLQALAEPGGIVISQSIFSEIRGRLEGTFVAMGPQSVKNIDEPIPAYRLLPADVAALETGSGSAPARGARYVIALGQRRPVLFLTALGVLVVGLGLAWNYPQGEARLSALLQLREPPRIDAGPLSIVVLPFSNLTGNEAESYVSDGITASVTADLSRIRDAFVVGAGTAQAYKGKSLTARQVGQELGVHYVLQGSVQRSGGLARINAQLTDTASNKQLWSDVFEGDGADLFKLQDQVTTRIGDSMGRELVVRAASESERRLMAPTVADLHLRARALELRPQTLANWQAVEELYRQILVLDPADTRAISGLARSLAIQVTNFNDYLSPDIQEAKLREAFDLATRARTLDPSDPAVYAALSGVAERRGDWDAMLRNDEIRLSLEPKSKRALNSVAVAHYWRAEPQKALELLERAVKLEPSYVEETLLVNLSRVHLMLGHYDEAIAFGLKAQSRGTKLGDWDPTLPVAYALKGDLKSARTAVRSALARTPAFSISYWRADTKSKAPKFVEYVEKTLIPGMRLAGFPE